MSTHTPVDVEFFALSGCSTQDCDHESDCPIITLTVCLDCNTTAQDGRPVEDWEGSAVRCPIFGTGTTPEQAEALLSALTVPQASVRDHPDGSA